MKHGIYAVSNCKALTKYSLPTCRAANYLAIAGKPHDAEKAAAYREYIRLLAAA